MASSPLVPQLHHHHPHRHTHHHSSNTNSQFAFDQIDSTVSNTFSLIGNRINSGTPKRRLSYNTSTSLNNSPTLNNPVMSKTRAAANNITENENSPQPASIEMEKCDSGSSSTNTTPFIKRKCINRDQSSVKINQISYRNSIVGSNSPYLISSVNLSNSNMSDANASPKHLNDSFESEYRGPRQRRSFKLFSKHKSAPLSNLTYSLLMNQSQQQPTINESHQPLNDISNHINIKSASNNVPIPSTSQISFKLNEEFSYSDEKRDDVTDLENLIYGNGTNDTVATTTTTNNQQSAQYDHTFIKHSLEIDAKYQNLIGDRTGHHVLPTITSTKHQDLHCISPETLVDVLNGQYNDQIDGCIIIDSRYPYEYEGGHISTALNIYTKDLLIEEMFIKRLHLSKTKTLRMFTSYSSNCLKSYADSDSSSCAMDTDENKNDLQKRFIVIFHCEFSSERGPSLLRFLRNQDRSLNEHCYPNLFYPELYLLEGGYKSFYESFKNYCEPQMYKPMLHAEHSEDLKHFRAKAKSWEVSRHQIFKSSEHFQKKISLNYLKSEQAQLIEDQENTIQDNKPHKIIKLKQKF